jgi:hypothetical protein
LGIYFDPKLTWNDHINEIEKRVKKKLHQLQCIAYSDKFKLSTMAIWKLYIQTIRPIMEYGLCIYANSNHIKKLEILQNKAIRIALRAKKTTKLLFLKTILNVQSMQQRLDIIRAKLWAKTTHAEKNSLKYYNLKSWYNFIINNGGNSNKNYNTRSNTYNTNQQFNINHLNSFKQSPYGNCYNLIRDITPSTEDIKFFNQPMPYRSPPCYTTNFPNNIYTFNSLDKFENEFEIDNNNWLQIWSDGSCFPNPGFGGCAAYFPQFEEMNIKYSFDHYTIINCAELMAIQLAATKIKNNYNSHFNNYKNIHFSFKHNVGEF